VYRITRSADTAIRNFPRCHCMVLLRRTCRMTVNSSRMWDVDISCLPTSTRVSSRGHSHRLATGVSKPDRRGYGATYRQRSGGEALRSDIMDDYFSRFCSFRLRCIVTFYLSAPGISTLTYPLTTCDRNTALCTKVHRAVKTMEMLHRLAQK